MKIIIFFSTSSYQEVALVLVRILNENSIKSPKLNALSLADSKAATKDMKPSAYSPTSSQAQGILGPF